MADRKDKHNDNNKDKKSSSKKNEGSISGSTLVWLLFLIAIPTFLAYWTMTMTAPLKSDRAGTAIGTGTGGAGSGQFRYPRGVAVTASGDIVVCDRGNKRLQVFSSDGKFLRTIGSPDNEVGKAAIERLGHRLSPEDIAIDRSTGHALVIEFHGLNNLVEDVSVWNVNTGELLHVYTRQYNGEPEGIGYVPGPEGLAIDQRTGDVYIAETARARLRVLGHSSLDSGATGDSFAKTELPHVRHVIARTPADTPSLAATMMLRDSKQDGYRNEEAELREPRRPLGVSIHNSEVEGEDDIVIVAYQNFNMVQVFNTRNDFLHQLGSGKIANNAGDLHGPWGVFLHPQHRVVVVAEWYNNRLSLFSLATGEFMRHIYTHDKPISIALLGDNQVVVSHDDHRVRIYSLEF